jgi:hypothetical protein
MLYSEILLYIQNNNNNLIINEIYSHCLQDVDGKSLLLMKRMDVLRGLKLKLGPALKIYNNHVIRMQLHHFSDLQH